MAEVLTTKFKTDITRFMYNDVTSSDMYVFVSGISLGSIVPVNSLKSENDFLSKALFGKKIASADIKYMIKYVPWNSGDTYVQFDDVEDLEDERFYAVVGPTQNDTGDYRVYKCLRNNYGGQVISPPNYDGAVQGQIYRTADGYVWIYMYAISLVEFEAYNALGYVPITGSFEADPVANTTVAGVISDVFVENPDINFGYVEITGNCEAAPAAGDQTIQVFSSLLLENPSYHESGYFIGQTLKAAKASTTTYYYTITGYTYFEGRGYFTVDGNPSNQVQKDATISITPRVKIEGDGTGAEAVASIVDGRINTIDMIDEGTGYNNSTATIIDPLFDFNPEDTTTVDIRALVRPVISPDGNHGYNLLDELKCKHIMLYGYITGDDNLQIGDTNTYNGVGIVKNPSFTIAAPDVFDNRIAVVTDDIAYVTANTTLIQIDSDNETIFSGTVHEVDLTSNTVYLAEYAGKYPSQPGLSVSIDTTLPFRNDAGTVITPNSPAVDNITIPDYVQRSGEVYFMEDFFPLERNELSREEFKIVLEF